MSARRTIKESIASAHLLDVDRKRDGRGRETKIPLTEIGK